MNLDYLTQKEYQDFVNNQCMTAVNGPWRTEYLHLDSSVWVSIGMSLRQGAELAFIG